MFKHTTYRRVTYGETDRMGYLYYGNYAEYYEVARVEGMRKLGIRYRDMEEDENVLMPVVSMEIKYLRPAKYDDLVRVECIIDKMPERDIHFSYNLYNENNKLLNTAKTTLTFVSKKSGKRCGITTDLKAKLLPFFAE